MRKVAVLALKKASKGGAFLITHQYEIEVLDAFPLWVTRLFNALLRCCDFHSGAGRVTYAHLVAMLTPIQPRRGPRHYVPDVQAIKKVVRELEARLVLARDKAHSEAEKTLIYELAPRYASVRPSPKLEPQTRTPVDSRKASKHAASSPVAVETRTLNSNPSFNNEFLHSKEGELSTCGQVDGRTAALATAKRLKAETRVRRAGGTPSSDRAARS
jgi:hypothetical protein